MAKTVREPIQVYLTPAERAELDRAASGLGVSRSEVLRRGIRAVGRPGAAGELGSLVEAGLITPATSGPGEAPPSLPVAPLQKVLASLEKDRGER